jgi:hypothetical protein
VGADAATIGAVIFFGALISAGNERQRKAIDDLREQTVLWAVQDLRIKRERLSREVRVDDPLGWLNRMAMKVCGHRLNLQVIEAFEEPTALLCASGIDAGRLLFSPLSPGETRRLNRDKHGRLSQYATPHPLFSLPRHAIADEISVLNGGILFDLELPLVWKSLTDQNEDQMERIWMYRIS